jgi:hypothetical protein
LQTFRIKRPRSLQNQVDIGNAIKPFYGVAAGTKLTTLLKEHILGAVEVLKAAKSGDTAWPLASMKAEMKTHLDLTLIEASNRLKGNYAEDVRDYDKVHEHILHLADTLSSEITKPIPR